MLITGPIWAHQAWSSYWNWDPKEVWAFITWVVYAAYLHARTTAGWKGRNAAILALVGVATLWFNFIGINYFSTTSQHSYASGAAIVSLQEPLARSAGASASGPRGCLRCRESLRQEVGVVVGTERRRSRACCRGRRCGQPSSRNAPRSRTPPPRRRAATRTSTRDKSRSPVVVRCSGPSDSGGLLVADYPEGVKEFWIYTALRVLLFVASAAVVFGIWLAVAGTAPIMWALVIAFLVSGVASYFLLNPPAHGVRPPGRRAGPPGRGEVRGDAGEGRRGLS